MTTVHPTINPTVNNLAPMASSFELSKLPTDKEPLPESEINIYNLIFKDQPIDTTQQKSSSSKLSRTKKILISFMFSCLLLLHAISPMASILKAFQGNTYVMILISVAYTALIYYAINTLLC
jgi:hypothetical protein